MDSKNAKENQKVGSSFGRVSSSRWLKRCCLAVIFLCTAAGAMAACNYLVAVDCSWSANVFTWIDNNADGIFQEGEPPMPGVNLFVNGALFGVSNAIGEATLKHFLPGCPDAKFEINAEVPDGYRLTTAETQFATHDEIGKSFQFGFTYLPGVPTVTPKPPSPLSCAAIQEFTGEHINSLASDQGGLWVASSGKVARLDFSTNTWEIYPGGKTYSGKASDIFVGPDGSVWLITQQMVNNSETIYKFNNGKWEVFSPQELEGKDVSSIAWAPDGRLWFSSLGQGIMIWDPGANVWTSDESDDFAFEVLFASDGKYFPISALGGGAIAPDGKVWGVGRLSFFTYGVYYDPVTQEITESAADNGQYIDQYSDMKFDEQGGMWLATLDDGLLYIPDPIKGSKASWQEYHRDIGFVSDHISDLLLQGNNVLWVATDEGLARCQIKSGLR